MKLPFSIDLSGKTALVTGGGGVLGAIFSRALAACGAKVAIMNRSLDKGSKVAEQIIQDGGQAMALSCDVLDEAALQKAREEIHARFGPVDILINAAGGNSPAATTDDEQFDSARQSVKDFFHLSPEGIRYAFDLNFLGTLLPTQVFAKDMIGRPDCCVVNISSMGAYLPMTKVMAYSGAKAAVSNLTHWLGTYFAKDGPRINAIAPGFFVTDQNRALLFDKQGQPTARTGKIMAATPMGRFGEPEELIGALLYLVSPDAARFVTGIVLPVDGGYTAYSGV